MNLKEINHALQWRFFLIMKLCFSEKKGLHSIVFMHIIYVHIQILKFEVPVLEKNVSM